MRHAGALQAAQALDAGSAAARKPLPVLAAPLGLACVLASFLAVPSVRENPRLVCTFLLVAASLAAWTGWLWVFAGRRERPLTWHFVLRRPHWLQPLVQLSIYLYWGWSWPVVYGSAHFILAQIVFAYAFDMLLFWSRKEDYELGLGPLPIILSMNLFLWFKPDWFHWQFLLVAGAFGGKQLLRWQKDGRLQHIFNPSSFPLAIASLLLIATGTVDTTWGDTIVSTISQPLYMCWFLFAVSIPGQVLFGVTVVTMTAVLTTFALYLGYYAIFGTYYFYGPIPVAIFLGMLLLVTDPATSPRTEPGKVIYGFLYGVSVFVIYGVLEVTHQTTFYEKLLFVPVLNLGVRWIDRVASSSRLARLRIAKRWAARPARQRHLAWLAAWTAAFLCVVAFDGMGDTHPGNHLPFWERACGENRRNACQHLDRLEAGYCERGSGWACNELAIRAFERPGSNPSATGRDLAILRTVGFERSCALGFAAGCANRDSHGRAGLRHQQPVPADYEMLLDSKLLPRTHSTLQLWQWACAQGWTDACVQFDAFADRAHSGRPPPEPRSF